MSVDLIIETSSLPFSIVLSEGTEVLYDSTDASGTRDLAPIVEAGLDVAGCRVGDIGRIAVDVGPGGLIAVRTGVAYANSLAFARGIPVCPFFSFEVMGLVAWKRTQLPVLCTARAAGGNAYVGLFDGHGITSMRFGPLEQVIETTTAGLQAFAVAGFHRAAIMKLSEHRHVHDSGVYSAQAGTFLELDDPFTRTRDALTGFVRPINEQSEIFRP